MVRKKKAEGADSSEDEMAVRQPNQTSNGPDKSAPANADADVARRGEEERTRGLTVVGIGGSAGGLEALKEFFHAMPADSGLAFVVVFHLDPTQKSALVEIVSGMTPIPVREVEDGMTVQPNHVYIMPQSRDVVISQGILHLIPRAAETPARHLPVDTFLCSLGEDRANQAIGVILSGTLADGTRGLKAVKENGGITFAQDETAKFGGMPQSAIAAGCVDYVLPPAPIATELLRICRHPSQAQAKAAPPPTVRGRQDAFLEILRLLKDTTGVDFTNYKHPTLRRRIERRMVLRRLQTLDEYLKCLHDDPGERQQLFDEVLISVTSFFRDSEFFDALKNIAFPRLLENRPADTPLRAWIPGCASGEEAYSLAMCLLEYLGTLAKPTPLKIFATDINERSLRAARAGVYGEGITAEISPERLRRFFVKTDRGYEITKAVRDVCVFARQDVTKDPPFSQLDLISCRNVLIYLGPVLQSRVLPILHYALKPGGLLVLGASETAGGFGDLFEVVDAKHKFYARTTTPPRLSIHYAPGAPPRTQVVVHETGVERGRGLQDVYRDADRVVLADYAPAGVVVDEHFQVVQVRGDTGHYLKLAAGPPTSDLLLMVREGLLADLRDAVDLAKRDNAPVRKDAVRVKTNDHFREIHLRVIPITDVSTGARHFVILFEEAAASKLREPVTPQDESSKDQEIGLLEQELNTTKDYLYSVIEQKESANEELRAANEEVISANEELQSTNEELETAKEELQATNEELTTVNDELQNRILTANQLSDDLVNLIEVTDIPIVVLGADLSVRRFTPSALQALNVGPSDVGRRVSDLKLKIDLPDLESLVHEVIDTLAIKQRELQDSEGNWHKLYIRPYKTLDQKIGGVVLMLVDIDVLKRREREVEESRDYAVSIVETVREPLIVLGSGLRVRTANRAFYQTFQVTPRETEGKLIYELGNGQWDIPRLRTLLEELLPQNSHFENFEVEHDFLGIGRRTMLLNAHRVVQLEGEAGQLILLAIEDISERKLAERLRQESEDRLRMIIDTARDAILTIDEHGIIVSANPAAEKMFDYRAEEMTGQNVKMLMPPPYREEHDSYLEHYRRTGEKRIIGMAREVRGRRQNGSFFPVDLTVSEFYVRTRRLFSGVLRDLSVRKALEREVVDAAAAEQGRIARELHDSAGQELTGLSMLAGTLVEALTKTFPAESVLARKIADGLGRVLVQVRDLSHGLMPVEVDAEGLMAALAELASRTTEPHGATCTFECLEPVLVEDNQTATHLYRIASEAVTNALKHSRAKNITISLEGDARAVTLSIRDDGVGLPEEPFEGRGMGLKIMRYRAGLMNAELNVDSVEPRGALVSCTVSSGVKRDEQMLGK